MKLYTVQYTPIFYQVLVPRRSSPLLAVLRTDWGFSLTLARISLFWLIDGHELKVIAVSQCQRHH